MIQAIALDSDRTSLTILDAFCQRAKGITLSRTFTQPEEARFYLQHNQVNLVFLEGQLLDRSGIEFWQTIRQRALATQVALPQLVLATASSEYAQISYEVQALDYLLKPFSYDRFSQTVLKAKDGLNQQPIRSGKPALYRSFRLDYGLVNVNLTDIIYVEALANYCKLYFDSRPPIVVRTTVKALLAELAPLDFLRVHRSYIVSLSHISAIRNKQIFLAGKQVPLGTHYERFVYDRFDALTFSSPH